jgi:3',5'-cyclic AMP phosphodiesterase CpdA
VVVAAAGDIASQGAPDGAQRMTALLVASWDPEVVLTLGDEQYAKGNLDDFQSSYDPTWGALLAITEPAPGNHEGYGDLVGYCAYFGARAHCPGGYHAFDAGAWRVVALNSAPGAISAEQIAFLSNELRNDDGRCQLVYWHHPRWSSGAGHGSDPELENAWAAAVAGGADVVLNGHEHNYERFAPMDADGNESADGTREFVVGTGGASLTPFAVPLPSSRARVIAHGALRLTLSADGYAWAFMDTEGQTRDSGTGSCH